MAKETENKQEITLDTVSEQVAKILSDAKAEASKIIADAKATISGELTDEQKADKVKREVYWNELVPRELFKDNDKYKDDVFVSVNGETCAIKRGEKVMIKRKFANVLDMSKEQDYYTSNLIERKSKEAKADELN